MSKFYYATIDSINGLLSYEAGSQEEVRQAMIELIEIRISECKDILCDDDNDYAEKKEALDEMDDLKDTLSDIKRQIVFTSSYETLSNTKDFCLRFYYGQSIKELKETIALYEDMSVEEYGDTYGWGDLR